MAADDVRAPAARQDVIWRRIDGVGLEHFRMGANANGPTLSGTVVTAESGEPHSITYAIQCDPLWRTREVLVEAVRGSRDEPVAIQLIVDGAGAWFRRAMSDRGVILEPMPEFSECVDIDLGFTPATNTLPLRRLELAEGEYARVTACWVQFPSLELTRLPQQYTRVGQRRYRYESFLHGFTAMLAVDDLGVVKSYERLWERVAATNGGG
jgi:hypothetical protein